MLLFTLIYYVHFTPTEMVCFKRFYFYFFRWLTLKVIENTREKYHYSYFISNSILLDVQRGTTQE